MKVYSGLDAVAAPTFDYSNYNHDKIAKQESDYVAALKAHLETMGYNGPYTGEVVSFGVADGSAQYLLADGNGRYGKSFLIHLDFCDGYHYNGIQHFPKSAIVAQIKSARELAKLFGQ